MPGQLRPSPTRPPSTAKPRYGLGVGLVALSVLAAALLCATDAVAQATTVVGQGGMPSVEVNLDAIDGGAREPRTPSGVRHFGVTTDQPIRLKPPKGMAGPSLRPLAKPAPPPAPRPPSGSLAIAPAPVQPAAPRVEPAPMTTKPAVPAAQDRTAMPTAVPRTTAGQPTAPPISAMPAARAPAAAPVARPMAPAAQEPKPALPARPVPAPPSPIAKPATPVVQAVKPVPPPPPPVPKAAPVSQAPAQEPNQSAAPPARQAALPKATTPLPDGKAMPIMFAEGSSALSAEATAMLGNLADQMARSDQRIQLKAIANSASGASPSATRRLSFSRALAVRAFLIERGVRSTRIDVRTLGSPDGGGPTERVDVILLPR